MTPASALTLKQSQCLNEGKCHAENLLGNTRRSTIFKCHAGLAFAVYAPHKRRGKRLLCKGMESPSRSSAMWCKVPFNGRDSNRLGRPSFDLNLADFHRSVHQKWFKPIFAVSHLGKSRNQLFFNCYLDFPNSNILNVELKIGF